jgi:hypothetical protein
MLNARLKIIRKADFDRTMRLYLKQTSKTQATALNQKAFWIMVNALNFTPKADVKKMRRELTWKKSNATRLRAWALKHQPQLKTDDERKAYFKDLKKKRGRSMGYLKAGWLTPIAIVKKAGGVKGKTTSKGVTQRGQKKGKAKPARDQWKCEVTFENLVGAMSGSGNKRSGQKHSQADAAKKFGNPALAKGFRKEQASMKRYLLKKMRETARRSRVA